MTIDLSRAESPWTAAAAPRRSAPPDPQRGYDFAVIGAGGLGATTALLLARAGHSVALLDSGDPVAESTTVHSTSARRRG